MDCRGYRQRLEELLDGTLDDAVRDAAQAHAGSCSECRELEKLARIGIDAAPEPPPELAGAVFARTCGSTCGAAEERLGDWVDGTLGRLDAQLLRSHLDCCAACSALARTLSQMAEELPALAEREPDGGFLADVVAATRPFDRRVARRLAALAEGWRRLLSRPRVAWEGAYVATFVVMLVIGIPGSPLAGVPHKALKLARTNPVDELKQPVSALETQLVGGIQSAWTATGAKVVDASTDAAVTTYREIKSDVGTLWRRLASEQESEDDKATAQSDTTVGERQ